MSHWLWSYLIIAAIAVPTFAYGWWRQRRTLDAGIVDVLWTFFTGFGSLFLLATGPGDAGLRLITAVMVSLWMIRLGAYVLGRMRSDGQEDGRYAMLRERWGSRAQPLFFGFFQLQVGFVLLFLIPFAVIAAAPAPPLAWFSVGLLLWLAAFVGVLMADQQLAAWRANPENRGRTCRQGLWAYSRHPNYFFEWLLWCSYIPLAMGSRSPWLTVITPVILLFLFYYVTGIPYAERQALRSRGEDYRRYQRQVSPFIPLPRKSLEEH